MSKASIESWTKVKGQSRTPANPRFTIQLSYIVSYQLLPSMQLDNSQFPSLCCAKSVAVRNVFALEQIWHVVPTIPDRSIPVPPTGWPVAFLEHFSGFLSQREVRTRCRQERRMKAETKTIQFNEETPVIFWHVADTSNECPVAGLSEFRSRLRSGLSPKRSE